MLYRLLLLAAFGAAGTLARYALVSLVDRHSDGAFPWGTLAVNGLGCLLFGAVWSMAEERLVISGETRLLVLTGFMGAFTTFSTFAFETQQLLRDGEWLAGIANVAAHNVLGIVCVMLGLAAGRQI